ncbi:MAG: MBL fold metallo-hydrolase [Pseudomonadales bacterium]|jgi:glyoxylase-like metal-dependent hydrolase (beta-lactamase superfamily II)|nr:MBL fold metallo-hydrolase [Pseudomonadales bacterium]
MTPTQPTTSMCRAGGRRWAASLITLLAIAPLGLAAAAQEDPAAPLVELESVAWIHGAADCEAARAAPAYTEWQQLRYQRDTWIFRQHKCENYEGPFVYLFVGTEQALLIDTGATRAGGDSLLRRVRALTDVPLTVAHSHGHGDHRQGDAAFADAPDVTLVGIGPRAVEAFFGFPDWPHTAIPLDLGDRTIEILPIPGHADDDLAFFDPVSGFLVTGDTLYPGRLYISDWAQYRASTARLAAWAADRPVTRVMGTHIEMSSTANIDYPIGTTHQPDEHRLPLAPADIVRLADAAAAMEVPARTYLEDFIIWPRS